MKEKLFQSLQESHQALTHCETVAGADQLRAHMEHLINELIQHDVAALINWLYRLDVDEKKIRAALQTEKEINAATLLTDLIIERQQQKIYSRKLFRPDTDIPEDERW